MRKRNQKHLCGVDSGRAIISKSKKGHLVSGEVKKFIEETLNGRGTADEIIF